jgi:hypothetical protein
VVYLFLDDAGFNLMIEIQARNTSGVPEDVFIDATSPSNYDAVITPDNN